MRKSTNLVESAFQPNIIIHQVDISHGYKLHSKVPEHLKVDPLWIEGADHNDIVHAYGPQYFSKLHEFFHNLEGQDYPNGASNSVHSPVHRGLQGSAEGPRRATGSTGNNDVRASSEDVHASLEITTS
jgi:hypothetical protein